MCCLRQFGFIHNLCDLRHSFQNHPQFSHLYQCGDNNLDQLETLLAWGSEMVRARGHFKRGCIQDLMVTWKLTSSHVSALWWAHLVTYVSSRVFPGTHKTTVPSRYRITSKDSNPTVTEHFSSDMRAKSRNPTLTGVLSNYWTGEMKSINYLNHRSPMFLVSWPRLHLDRQKSKDRQWIIDVSSQ